MVKKVKLSLGELLEQTLVIDEDKPYDVPSNWVWTRFGNIIEFSKDKFNPYVSDSELKYVGLEHLEKNRGIITVGSSSEINSTKNIFKENDIIYGRLRPYLNKHDIAKFDGICSTDILVFRCIKTICINKFINYYLDTDNVILYTVANSKGINLPRVSEKELSVMQFPLPPLPEQQRIVNLIDSLFEKLNRAKELVQNALDSFEERKSAILHKAFTGELTAKWREENGVDFERDWVEKAFGELGKLERGRSRHRPRNAPELFGGDNPFIQTGDVANANIYITEHKQTLSEIGLKQSKLFPKDTLCITIAANIGDVAILSYDCCFPDSVVGFTPNEQTSSKFIYYYMSIMQSEIEHFAPATAQKNINLKILNDITIKTPSLKEQKEIVRILDTVLEKEQKSNELCDVIDNIDLMKKSILARAFRGELSTNNPDEESALELLKEVFRERVGI